MPTLPPGISPSIPARPRLNAGIVALAEVSLAFALMHVAFRAFKRFTQLGQLEWKHDVNLSPGVAMVLVAVGFILLRRKRLAEYGLTMRGFPPRRRCCTGCCARRPGPS